MATYHHQALRSYREDVSLPWGPPQSTAGLKRHHHALTVSVHFAQPWKETGEDTPISYRIWNSGKCATVVEWEDLITAVDPVVFVFVVLVH